MAVVSYPGVYVEEVSSGVRPIAAASTSTPAFVGLAEMGPDDVARRVTSWTEFQKYYGTYINDGFLAYSVFQFFNNGGSLCYIVRITRSESTPGAGDGAVPADVTVENRAPTPIANGLTFSAKNSGAWGNFLYLQIEDGTLDPGNTAKISIRRQEVVDIVPEDFINIAPLEVHDNLSMDENSSDFMETALRQNSDLIDVDVLASNDSLQRGTHYSGYGPSPMENDNLNFQISIDHDIFQLVQLPNSLLGVTDLGVIATEIQAVVTSLGPELASIDVDAYPEFICRVDPVPDSAGDSRLILESGTNRDPLSSTNIQESSVRILNASSNNAAISLRLGEGNGGLSEDALAVRRPPLADAIQVGDAAVASPITAVRRGSDGEATLNELSYRAGFSLLDEITDFSLLAVPGIGTEVMVDEGMNYCSNIRSLRDVFYIGEMTEHHDLVGEAEDFRDSLTQPNSYGAVFFPWIQALDPSGQSEEPILLPPSGYIAGLFARIDSRRGVWKAPAGTEATLSGAVGLAVNLTDVEQGILNPKNVNCIRRFTAAGIVSWGARTITSDPEWTYLSVRRMAIMIRVSIYYGIQWAVFEPNDEELWSQLRLNITSFMMTLHRQGAFQGSTPSDAFFVKCDSETTTQGDIDRGIVNVLVGFAPLKPAEFVVVKISQKAGQSA